MNRRRLERGRLAGEQACCRPASVSSMRRRESKLAAPRIGAHLAAGGGDRDLQAPAAAEERYAGGEDGLGEFDLARHRRAAVVDIERRSGHRHAVVVLETDARRKSWRRRRAVTMSICSEGSIRRSTRA